MTCARCDWKPDLDETPSTQRRTEATRQLVEHAQHAQHPLCLLTRRRPHSLTEREPRVCETCLTATRATLAAVTAMWAELPAHRRGTNATVHDTERPSAADGRPLPGGDLLVLHSHGSTGNIPRKLTPGEHAAGLTGNEHRVDNREDDPPSVAHTLASWEDDWRHTRNEPAAVTSGTVEATLTAAACYLERHMRWASVSHDAFDEFADELHSLHARLEVATSRSERTVVAEAECLDCGGDLVRKLDKTVGYADLWTCRRCRRNYDWPAYLRACAEHVEVGRRWLRGAGWGTPQTVSAAVGVPVETVRTWAKRGQVGACCIVEGGALLVSYSDAEERAEARREHVERRATRRTDVVA